MNNYYRDYFFGNVLESANGAAVFSRSTGLGTGITGRPIYLSLPDSNIFTDAVIVSQSTSFVVVWVYGATTQTQFNHNVTPPAGTVTINAIAYNATYVGHAKIASYQPGAYNLYDLETITTNLLKIDTPVDEIRFKVAYPNGTIATNVGNIVSALRLEFTDPNSGTGGGGGIC